MHTRFMAAVTLGLAPCALAQPYIVNVEDRFENGQNTGEWSFVTAGGQIDPAGGNCDGFFRGQVNAGIPVLRSSAAGAFAGRYHNAGLGVNLDLKLFAGDAAGRTVSMMLISQNGTPTDPGDDWGAYTVGAAAAPQPGQGWKRYSFQIPPEFGPLPPEWHLVRFGPAAPAPSWPVLLLRIDHAAFSIGDPVAQPPPQPWEIGADNIQILGGEDYCPANCDGSTIPPVLGVNDFVCFMNRYAAGDTWANCDYSTACPFLNINDFICFMGRYAQGCP